MNGLKSRKTSQFNHTPFRNGYFHSVSVTNSHISRYIQSQGGTGVMVLQFNNITCSGNSVQFTNATNASQHNGVFVMPAGVTNTVINEFGGTSRRMLLIEQIFSINLDNLEIYYQQYQQIKC